MPLITSQPCSRHNIPDSVLEANSLKVSRDMEWENEWNHSGLASGLTPVVQYIYCSIENYLLIFRFVSNEGRG